MALPAIIEIGAIDFTLLQSTKEFALYRVEDLTIPPMYRRTLTLTAKPNSSGTNVNVAFKLVTPVVVTVDGTVSAKNRRVFSGTYTSLQNVIDISEGKDILDVAVALTALKGNFVNGSF